MRHSFKNGESEKLMPNIPDNSNILWTMHLIIIHYPQVLLRNLVVHSMRIWNWLVENQIPCEKNSLKAELVTVLKKIAPLPVYEIDEMAKKQGLEILRTPPAQKELQPIELCWGIVKNHIARHCDFTLSNLRSQLEQGFESF